jgi:hypothetical protein
MEDAWLTYREAAERLGSTAEAIRYRALRGKWPRRRGNDGRARVQVPDEPNPVRTPSAQDVRTPSEPRADSALVETLKAQIAALEAHVETLKAQLAAAEARDAGHVAELAGEKARLVEQDARHIAELTAERARTQKAIEAFAALAERLDALAAERARPWWKRVTG